jgi:hypothetical protein
LALFRVYPYSFYRSALRLGTAGLPAVTKTGKNMLYSSDYTFTRLSFYTDLNVHAFPPIPRTFNG